MLDAKLSVESLPKLNKAKTITRKAKKKFRIPRSITDALPVSKSVFIVENQGKFSKVYTFDKQLGQGTLFITPAGSYGIVYKVIHKATKEKRAIKLIEKAKVPKGNESGLFSEVEVLKEMDHPAIVRVYEFGSDKDMYYLVTE